MNKYLLIFLGVGLVGLAAWFFLFRKKGADVSKPWVGESAGSSGSAVRSVAAPYLPQSQTPLALPQNVTPSPSSSISVRDGLTLAATAGCVAYTGGAGAPLCGIAAPLAVSGAIAGGKAVASGAKKLFSSIF